MNKEQLQAEIINNPAFGKSFNEAVATLFRLRVIEYLRLLGKPMSGDVNSPNFLQQQAIYSARSIGYNQALDDLINFQDQFVYSLENTSTPIDYGGLRQAIERGDLTEKEAYGDR